MTGNAAPAEKLFAVAQGCPSTFNGVPPDGGRAAPLDEADEPCCGVAEAPLSEEEGAPCGKLAVVVVVVVPAAAAAVAASRSSFLSQSATKGTCLSQAHSSSPALRSRTRSGEALVALIMANVPHDPPLVYHVCHPGHPPPEEAPLNAVSPMRHALRVAQKGVLMVGARRW